MNRRSRVVALAGTAALAALAFGVTANGGVRSTSAVPPGYNGVEAKLPTAYARPAKKAGKKCTIGYQNPIAANDTLLAWQNGLVKQAKVFGCKTIALDDALSPDKQVTNMQQLLAQGANVIVFYPLDPKATIPVLKQAKKKGVPVLAVDATFGSPSAKAPYLPYITSQVWQGRDIQAFLQAKQMAKAKPGAKVGLIGIGAPVPALKYLTQREGFWAKKNGLTIVGSQDNPTDDVTGGEKAANGLLQRYPNINAIIGYNDPSAIGAVTAARGAGRQIVSIGVNGSSEGTTALKAGRIAATVRVDSVGWGIQQAYAAYDLITKQHLPLPKIIVRPSTLLTKSNVNSVPSWSAQIKAIH